MNQIVLRIILSFCLCFIFVTTAIAAVAEYPLFSRLEGFSYDQKASRDEAFGSHKFKMDKIDKNSQAVEGRFMSLRYKLDKDKVSPGQLYIVKNIVNAVIHAGGEIFYENRGVATRSTHCCYGRYFTRWRNFL